METESNKIYSEISNVKKNIGQDINFNVDGGLKERKCIHVKCNNYSPFYPECSDCLVAHNLKGNYNFSDLQWMKKIQRTRKKALQLERSILQLQYYSFIINFIES